MQERLKGYPEVLAALAVIIHAGLRQHLTNENASTLALEIVDEVRRVFSGVQVYIPCSSTLERTCRNARIRAEFDGSNARALACRYRLTLASVYAILNLKGTAAQAHVKNREEP